MRTVIIRLFAGTLGIIIVLMTTVGCKNNDESQPSVSGHNETSYIKELSEYVYIVNSIPIPRDTEEIGFPTTYCFYDDTLYYYSTTYTNTAYEYNGKLLDVNELHSEIHMMNTDGTNNRKLEQYTPAKAAPENTYNWSVINAMHVDNAGNIWIVESWNHFRYRVPPEHDEEINEIWELYDYFESVEKGATVRKLNYAGIELLSIDISSIEFVYPYFSVEAFYIDDSQNVFLSDRNLNYIYLIDGTDNSIEKIDTHLSTDRIFTLSDGTVVFSSLAVDGNDNWSQALQVIDISDKKLGEPIPIPFGDGMDITPGSGNYDLFAANHLCLYGYTFGENEPVKILDWSDSDITYVGVKSISNFKIDTAGNIVCVRIDFSSPYIYSEIITLTKALRSEIPEKTILTLGCVGYGIDYDIRNSVSQFNRTNSDYRIKVIDYSEYNTDNTYFGGLERFAHDVTVGNIPDIIDTSFLPYRDYAIKGLFTDLYPFIDVDPDFNRNDFIANILEAAEIDGSLYQIFPSFEVYTLIGNQAVVGTDIGWSINEFKAVLAEHPEADIPLGTYMTKSHFLFCAFDSGLSDYVDRNNGAVNFDSEEFIMLLELADMFPAEIEWENQVPIDEVLRDGRAIMSQEFISSFSYYALLKTMHGGEIVLKGFPTIYGGGGNVLHFEGGLAISDNSPYKEAAWLFIRDLLKNDLLLQNDKFSTNQSAFLQRADDEIIAGTNNSLLLEFFTEQDLEHLITAITSPSIRAYDTSDEIIWNIVSEEAYNYFNGIISAEDAAQNIQFKVEMYISERS